MTGRVVVTHPTHQHAYEIVAADQRAGLLDRFITGLYRTGQGAGDPARWWFAPPPFRAGVPTLLARRHHPDVDARDVELVPAPQLAQFAQRSLPRPGPLHGWDDVAWLEARFDAAAARRLRRGPAPGLVHAFEGSALETLTAARHRGAVAVLDVPSAHARFHAAIVSEGGEIHPRRTARIHAERAVADWFAAAPGPAVEELIEAGVDPARILVIPYGADPDRFAARRRPGAAGQPFRVLFAGGEVGLRKGLRYLLEAWERFDRDGAELILAGPVSPEGKTLLRRTAARPRVLGRVAGGELAILLAGADVLAFPSLAESSALVVYEAMAAGRPVVTTPEAGPVIRDGVDGIIVPARDPAALAGALARLRNDPDLRRRLGAQARERILAAYTWEHYRARIVAAHRALLEGGDPHAAIAAATPRQPGRSATSPASSRPRAS